jgi:hypothetical protein
MQMVALFADFHHKLLLQMSAMPKLHGVAHLSHMVLSPNLAALHLSKLPAQVQKQLLLSLAQRVDSILLQRHEKFAA